MTMHTVIETNAYLSAAKDAGMSQEDLDAVIEIVATDPHAGEVMKETGGCRKFRLAGRGWGKSGGYRVVHVYGGDAIPVFLLTVFGKGEKDNLTKAERNAMSKAVKQMIANYGKKGKTK